MEFKFSKGVDDDSREEPASGNKNRSALLLLLLLLAGGFSYVYFFTGIITPQESIRPAEAPVASQAVKIKMPQRSGDAIKAEVKPAEVNMKEPEPVKPKEELTKVEPAKPAEIKPAEIKPAKVETKPVLAQKNSEPAKTDVKIVSKETATKQKAPPLKTAKAAKVMSNSTGSGNAWSIMVGSYVLKDALATDMERVRKAGLSPVAKPGARIKSTMNRLFLSEFKNRADALAVLDKLKRHTPDAFILNQAGKYAVYAGSYLLDARAASEMERLNAAGFNVSLKHAEIEVKSQSLTLGPFSDKKSADDALVKLNAAGLKAALSKL
jgi:cell division protein FtsN